MRSIKSVGGLTRGRGFKDSSSLVWLLSMPACGEVHKAIREVTGLDSTDSVKTHKDLEPARRKHDAKDVLSIMQYLVESTIRTIQ